MSPADATLTRARALAARYRQLVTFPLVGDINTLFGLALYPALLWGIPVLQRQYMLGLLIAQAISLCFAYATYKRTMFRTRGNLHGGDISHRRGQRSQSDRLCIIQIQG